MRRRYTIGLVLALAGGLACSADAGGSADAGSGLGTGDGDGDGDGDGGGDGDGDGDDGPGPDTPPPEEEEEGDFRVPKASGQYVYSANETTDRVAVIDTDSLVIDVVDVGKGPTSVAAIPGQGVGKGAVAVLCEISDEVAIIRTLGLGDNDVRLVPVADGTNQVAVTPDGKWVFVYHDVDAPQTPGAGTDQEVTVVSTAPAGATHELTIGAHPRDIQFTADSAFAYAITDDGVNVIELAEIAEVGKPDVVPVVADQAVDPALLEIQLSVGERQALARVEGEDWLVVTDLETTAQTELDLPSVPTDLDVSADGSLAILVLPHLGGSEVVQVPLPAADYEVFAVGEEYVGLSDLTPDGQTMLLYTTVNPGDMGPLGDPRERLTIARRAGGDWLDQVTIFTEVPVRSVGVAPDSENAILLHESAPELNQAAPWPYTLLDLAAVFPLKKLQMVEAEPGPLLFTPNGKRAAVQIRSENLDVRRVDVVDLGTFIVDALTMGALPAGLGYVDVTDKIYVSQEHPSGRITFIDADGATQTATGYELNDAVKD